jgi:hypothetical protein
MVFPQVVVFLEPYTHGYQGSTAIFVEILAGFLNVNGQADSKILSDPK